MKTVLTLGIFFAIAALYGTILYASGTTTTLATTTPTTTLATTSVTTSTTLATTSVLNITVTPNEKTIFEGGFKIFRATPSDKKYSWQIVAEDCTNLYSGCTAYLSSYGPSSFTLNTIKLGLGTGLYIIYAIHPNQAPISSGSSTFFIGKQDSVIFRVWNYSTRATFLQARVWYDQFPGNYVGNGKYQNASAYNTIRLTSDGGIIYSVVAPKPHFSDGLHTIYLATYGQGSSFTGVYALNSTFWPQAGSFNGTNATRVLKLVVNANGQKLTLVSSNVITVG